MKKIFALLLCLSMVFALVACGGGEETLTDGSDASVDASTETSTDTSSNTSTNTNGSWGDLPEDTVPNLVIANDQIKERAVIYDLDAYEEGDTLDDLEVWSVPTGHAAGVKYREDTVFGDVVIVAGSQTSAIYKYPSKEVVWSTSNPGNNPHSIEILPSGNIVIANSTGNCLRVFSASAILDGNKGVAQKFTDYTLKGAHGVLWDPEYEVLWALGGYELAAYAISGTGTGEKLSKVGGMGCDISKLGYGHDLQPDYTDTRYLYFTAGNAYRFDKEENKAGSFPQASTMQQKEIKGFSNNPNGNVFTTGPLGGAGKFFANSSKESWLTDTIYFFTKKVVKDRVVVTKNEFVSESSAFYKVRAFYGQYQ
ncbi:MAG: hypothetical protein J6C26_02755 [Clostridia bacterium]|nr:hypothetical protein [Clostridia bacterium]